MGIASLSCRKGEDAVFCGFSALLHVLSWTSDEDLEYRFRDHAWFASFAPAEDPELVVVVFVEHGGHGGNAAAPLAKSIYERHFSTLPSPSDT